MAVLGVIAEFNPFHNGHLYFINEAKAKYNFSTVVCVMSGNFTQRGEPALCNKWVRAEMALQNGADLIIELPLVFASRSAYNFAKGAISLLNNTGVISHLAFGSENNDINTLQKVALLLNNEPDKYREMLAGFLAKGHNYPVARSYALAEFYNDSKIFEVLTGSNNILAIEYLRVLAEIHSPIIPFTIKRQGSSYHSTFLTEFASATAIRNALYQGIDITKLSTSIPAASNFILLREMELGRIPIDYHIWEQLVIARIRTMKTEDIELVLDVTEGLEKRIMAKSNQNTNLPELILGIKSKRYSYSRINRILLYALFNITKSLSNELDSYGPLYYHVLGFTDKGKAVLEKIQHKSHLPIISRGRDIKEIYKDKNSPAGKMIQLDIMATNLYNLLYPNPNYRIGDSDYTTSPLIF